MRNDEGRHDSAMSQNPEALGAYRAGLQATRDAAFDAAWRNFLHAAELDPEFAAAHLRYAITSSITNDSIREHYREATRLRFTLSDHDRTILEAFEPWMREPRDPREAERRMALAVAAHPRDADYLHLLCRIRFLLADYKGSLAACEDTIRNDPEFAGALWIRALNLDFSGDEKGAIEAFADCLRVSPAATACLNDRFQLEANTGQCEDALDDSRRLIALDPGNWRAYKFLANALAGVGAPRESVHLAMEQWLERRDVKFRARDQARAEAALAINAGDFDTARKRLSDWDSALGTSSDEFAHVDVMRSGAELALELEQPAVASKIAAEFIARVRAWSSTTLFYYDSRIAAWSIQARAGTRGHSEFAALRDAWLDAEGARAQASPHPTTSPGVRWTEAFAEPSATPTDADEALRALPRFLPLPDAWTRNPSFDEPIGRVYLLAGRIDDALPHLTRAARACLRLDLPLESIWATVELADALDAKGDRAAACAAYTSITKRLAPAISVSRSAKRAAARARALGCGADSPDK